VSGDAFIDAVNEIAEARTIPPNSLSQTALVQRARALAQQSVDAVSDRIVEHECVLVYPSHNYSLLRIRLN